MRQMSRERTEDVVRWIIDRPALVETHFPDLGRWHRFAVKILEGEEWVEVTGVALREGDTLYLDEVLSAPQNALLTR